MSEKTKTLSLKTQRYQTMRKWGLRVAILLASFLLTTMILTFEKKESLGGSSLEVGEPAPKTLFSPFNLVYENEAETEILRQTASASVPFVLRQEGDYTNKVRVQIDQFFAELIQFQTQSKNVPEGGVSEAPVDEVTLSMTLEQDHKQFLLQEADLEQVRKHLEELIEQHLNQPILSDAQKQDFMDKNIEEFVILQGNEESEKVIYSVATVDEVKQIASGFLKGILSKSRKERSAALDIFNQILRSNLTADAEMTKQRIELAIASVNPATEEIKKNELIVQRGMLLTDEAKARLDRIHELMAKQEAVSNFLAIGLLVFLVYLTGFLYMLFFEKKIFESFRMTLLMHSVFLLTVLLCKAVVLWLPASPYLMPVALAALLITLLINSRLGLFSAAVMVLVTSPLSGFNVEVMMGALLSSAAGVIAAFKLRKRIHFLIVGVAIGVMNALVIFAFQILDANTVQESLYISVQGIANGLLITTPIVFMILPLFEYLFDLVTDVTLLEYSDLNHPLLKRMIVEAPGTYHHSLVVSTLAESACEAIGANGLLARVGCYFHDIGKIARSEYFTENQKSPTASKHEKLTPTMSCLIIMNHVKEGIELGRKHKLRKPILDFIPEHQGTGIIYYFYKKAMDQAEPGERVNPEDYRYPGPKPQRRETAVGLLADSIEATSRSLKNPTPESIRQTVRKIINDKFIDGQLDECNLSLQDLHNIQESFVQNLMAIYHTRVAYPDKPEMEDKVDLFKDDSSSEFKFKS